MRRLYIMAVAIVCLMASCSQNDMFEQEFKPTLNATGEVLFSATSGEGTRTIYDYDSDDKSSIAVMWLKDDLISVFGTNCANGREQAEYKVTPADAAGGTTASNRFYYAKSLNPTGDYGVQWGDADENGVVKSDFYAVYPSTKGEIEKTADDKGVVVPMSIATEQYNRFSDNGNGVIKGIPFNQITRTEGMNDAIMYACTPGAVAETDANGTPKAVDLKFTPYSTVLKFSVPTWFGDTNSEMKPNQTGKSIQVTSIVLNAPSKIAGNFDLTINSSDKKASATVGSNSQIIIYPEGDLKWEYGKKLEFSVFAIPVEGNLSEEWTITFYTSGTGNIQIKLKPVVEVGTAPTKVTLTPGKIHAVNITEGFPVQAVWEYNPASWMTTIPRNVYISDLSLPGSWYACDDGYQDHSLKDQFTKGIRAFNIDCRLSLAADKSVKSSYTMTDYEDGTLVLTCAGTEVHSSSSITSRKTVEQALGELVGLLVDHKDEFIEVILTVSQKEKTNSSTKYGTVNPQMMLRAISDVLNDGKVTVGTTTTDIKDHIYGPITPNTTLNDVLGKMVVKVNVNTSDDNIRSWNYSAPMLVSNGSMAEEASGNIVAGIFDRMNTTPMYWSNEYITEPENAGYMTFYYHQAQETNNDGPTIATRKTAINDIITKSYAIYADNTHDAMFQIGIGGWVMDGILFWKTEDKNAVSSELKPYVYNIINSMLNGTEYNGTKYTPAPVGAVLMNHSTAGSTHSTDALIKAIIDLNGKYFLNRDNSKPAWPNIPGVGGSNGEDKDPNEEDDTEEGEGDEV